MTKQKYLLVTLLITLTLSLHIPNLSHRVDTTDATQNQFHDQMTATRKSISNRIDFYKKTNENKYKKLIDYN